MIYSLLLNSIFMPISEFFALWTRNKILLTLLILVNLAGTAFGIYYYWGQLAATLPLLWPFVLDCPAYTALFAICLTLLLLGKRLPGPLAALTSFGLIKTGLWTVLTILLYNGFFFSPQHTLYFSVLLGLHVGMVLEAGVLGRFISFDTKLLTAIAAWFFVGDIFDYVVGTVPWPVPFLNNLTYFGLLGTESFAATAALTVALWWFGNRKS